MIWNRKPEKGQALIIIVFAVIGMIAMTGLAIDGGHAFSDRRQAQNAADTASLAGALAKLQIERADLFAGTNTSNGTIEATIINTAKNIAIQNGYTDNKVDDTIEVHWPPVDGPYSCVESSECRNYVQVVILSNIDTYFAKIVGVSQLNNRVEAVALAKEPTLTGLFGGYAFAELKPGSGNGTNCLSGEFVLGGSGTVVVDGGGIFVNSNSECSFNQNGCNTTLKVINGGSIDAAGEIALDPSCSTNVESDLNEQVRPQIEIPDHEMELPAPSECNVTPPPMIVRVNDYGDKIATAFPGSYENFPPPNAPAKIIELTPGVYCVDRLDFKSSKVPRDPAQENFKGLGVFIYIRPGGTFNIVGGKTTLTAYTGPKVIYQGYLIYAAPGNADWSGIAPGCEIAGNAESTFTGTILAPYCDVTISGESSPTGLRVQVIGWTVKLAGNNTLWITYEEDEGGKKYVPPETGIFR